MKKEAILLKFEGELRRRSRSRNTRENYLGWARRYVDFCRRTRPASVEVGISEFLGSLNPCTVATQKQALSALAGRNGLYACLGKEVGELPAWCYAKRPKRIPVWTTQREAEELVERLPEPWDLVASLLNGSGLRIGEAMALRWRAFDFERGTVSVWGGKGDKCRIAPLSARVIPELMRRRERCRALWEKDRRQKRPGVAPVRELARKSPRHGEDWPFFWVFPAAGESRDPASGVVRRHHVLASSFGRALRKAVRECGLAKRVTAHSFRHGFATAYLLAGGNLRELQERMGHEDLETTQQYLHCLPQEADRIGSPWDVGNAPMAGKVVPLRRVG